MYTEIKHPFAHLAKDHNTVVFFEHDFIRTTHPEDEPIASWDDISGNYPRWSMATHTKEGAINRVKEMVEDEGWELYETTENELQSLVSV